MRYTARALHDASHAPPITVGRVPQRRGLRWWWVTRCRTWTPRPVSTAQMLALQGTQHDPVAYVVTLAGVLRAVFPRRWWYRVTGDPLRILMRLPDALRREVLSALLRLPDGIHEADPDPHAALRAAQRASVYGKAEAAQGPSLAIVALTVQHAMGMAWYQGAHWPTSDGTPPFAVTWLTFVGLQAIGSQRRLEVADGMALLHAKDPTRARRQLAQQAYPTEVH